MLEGGLKRPPARATSDVPSLISMDTMTSTPLMGTSTHTKKDKFS